MICNHAHECGSTECEHRKPHPTNEFCSDGKCRWAGDTRCVPETKRERTELLVNELIMDDRFAKLTGAELVARITQIVEEVTENERNTTHQA